jgi:hypothetical protein
MPDPSSNLIPRVPEPDKDPARNRQFVDRVQKFVNDLIGRGDATRDSDGNWQVSGGGGGGSVGTATNGFRISASSTEPVPTVDLTTEDHIYLSPYKSNQIAIYTGSAWAVRESPQVSINLSGLLTADKNFDVFAYWTGSAVALELSAAWTNGSTRADAVAQQDGVWTLTADPTRRLVGTIRAVDGSNVDDTVLKRFVWNADNRVRRVLRFAGNSGTHNYTIATWRPAAGNNASAVEVVCGLVGDEIHLSILQVSDNSLTGGRWVGVSDNSLSTPDLANMVMMSPHIVGNGFSFCWYDAVPAIGYHKFNWMELSDATGTTTWLDTFTNAAITEQAGMRGQWNA